MADNIESHEYASSPAQPEDISPDIKIGDVVKGLIQEALASFQAGQIFRSLELAGQVLRLRPQHQRARLIRAEAFLHDQGYPSALADFRFLINVSRHAPTLRAARIGAAQALEHLGEFDAALVLLENVSDEHADHLRRRLRRRQDSRPAILTQAVDGLVMHDDLSRIATPSPSIHGYFAIIVQRSGRPVNMAYEAWANDFLNASYEFVEFLGELRNTEGDPVFALRWINQPATNPLQQGQLEISLITRVTAQTVDDCESQALEIWRTIQSTLPGSKRAYYFEPVVDDEKLSSLLQPFSLDYVAEIARRETLLAGNENRYVVYPFLPSAPDLHKLCQALLNQSVPAMLSIHLLPTSLMSWEQMTLNQIVLDDGRDSEMVPVTEQDTNRYDPVSDWWKLMPRVEQAQISRYLAESLRSGAYVLRVTVAAAEGYHPLFAKQVASALFGLPHPVNGVPHGGYEIIPARTSEEKAIAHCNLATIDIEGWGFSAAPSSCARLRHLVSEREAALAFRLPVPDSMGVPGVAVIDIRPVAPPSNLPDRGVVLGRSVAQVGSNHVRVQQELGDRRRHTYMVGKTGTGKSTLLKNLALQDIEAGHGVCLIDPHGDLVEEIEARIPDHRVQDVIYFDPSDHARPIGLNLLEARSDHEKNMIVNEFIGLLIIMYDPHNSGIVGPRFQHNVRNAMLTVMSVEGGTLIEVVRALSDRRYVRSLLPHVTDPMVRSYWEDQIANTADFHKSEVLDYIVSKFSRFVGDERVRNIVGQRRSTLDFRSIMNERKILLVNLSKGKIGPENSQFLGLLLMQRLLLTALGRAELPPNQRPDFMLYVDEFQNFATTLFATVLSEGRKYGIAATIANQYLTQIPPAIRESIFGNVGSLISFTVGIQDGIALAPEVYPAFDPNDLINLPKHTACVKLLVDGMAARPFAMRTLPDLRPANQARAQLIRKLSRERYGRDKEAVRAEIQERFRPKDE